MLTLLQPAFLWLGLLAIPLVALYILKARRERRDVAAVWLWEEAHRDLEARVPFRRLRRDVLLLLQLLILILLVAAAAGPYRRFQIGLGSDIAVVVDASASMLAGERPVQLETALNELVDGMGIGDRMAIVRAGPLPEVLAPLDAGRDEMLAAVARARAGTAPASLGDAVDLAASLVDGVESVVVVTDRSSTPPAGPRVLRIGNADENLENTAIVALGVRAADTSGLDYQVFVRLVHAGDNDASGTLRLRVDGQLRDAVELTVPANDELGHTFQLNTLKENSATAETLVEVEWEAVALTADVLASTALAPNVLPNALTLDALAADNRAVHVVRPPTPRRYRVLGRADRFLARALAANEEWSITTGSGANPDVDLVVGTTPPEGNTPFLWINPPADALPRLGSASDALVNGSAVLWWDRTHPVLRFLDLRAVRLGRVPRLVRPQGARVLATSSAGPLIFEGFDGQRRYLVWAFDPMETDLPLRVIFPLLVRHSLEHLAPSDGSIGLVATGAATSLAGQRLAGDKARLVSPSGVQRRITTSGGVLRLPPLEEAGVWRLINEEQVDREQVNEETANNDLRFGAALLDPQESDLRAGGGAVARASQNQEAELRETLRGLWRPLTLVALVLLLLEAAAFHRRRL